MKRIHIIAWDNGGGSSRNIKITSDMLDQPGIQVSVTRVPDMAHRIGPYRIARYVQALLIFGLYKLPANLPKFRSGPKFDLNLFEEILVPQWFPHARVNCLIPNPEWFRSHWRPFLPGIDWVLCKTRHAQTIFGGLGCRTEFVSFSSMDRFEKGYSKDYNSFFHLAGRSLQKGTNVLIDLWARHPEWPRLTIIQSPANARQVSVPNVDYISAYLDDAVLRRLQNIHGVHLCPSEAEGFGHYIVEAMSCKALTVTTNAPPMNELATPDRAVLVDYYTTSPQRLGTNFYVDPHALESKIDTILGSDNATKKRLGENARQWYEENDRFFKRKLVEVVSSL